HAVVAALVAAVEVEHYRPVMKFRVMRRQPDAVLVLVPVEGDMPFQECRMPRAAGSKQDCQDYCTGSHPDAERSEAEGSVWDGWRAAQPTPFPRYARNDIHSNKSYSAAGSGAGSATSERQVSKTYRSQCSRKTSRTMSQRPERPGTSPRLFSLMRCPRL